MTRGIQSKKYSKSGYCLAPSQKQPGELTGVTHPHFCISCAQLSQQQMKPQRKMTDTLEYAKD